ncbi:YcxB family protein [Devosia sp.]|uniref:YcxB family protein n=1 Tax=Devosia sp. TaxID=1871048 RepID=UPI003FA587E6
MQQEVEVSWTDTHLSLTQPNAHQTRTWSDIKSWAEDDGVIVLFEAGPIFVPIPKRALTTVLLSEMRDSLSQAGVPKARLFLL